MARTKKEFSVRDLIFIAIFTAAICLISPWTFGSAGSAGIPVTAATCILCLTAAVLGFKRSLICVVIYLVLAALGVPVLAGWDGGYMNFVGSCAGYLAGYLALVAIAGIIIDRNPKNAYMYFIGMIAGVAFCCLLGSIWLMVYSGTDFITAMDSGFRPFLSAECIKIFIAAMIGYPLRGLVKKVIN